MLHFWINLSLLVSLEVWLANGVACNTVNLLLFLLLCLCVVCFSLCFCWHPNPNQGQFSLKSKSAPLVSCPVPSNYASVHYIFWSVSKVVFYMDLFKVKEVQVLRISSYSELWICLLVLNFKPTFLNNFLDVFFLVVSLNNQRKVFQIFTWIPTTKTHPRTDSKRTYTFQLIHHYH